MKSSKYIKAARILSGLTQKEAADVSGYDQGYFSRLENGKTDISLSKFVELCGKLGVDPGEVINRVLGIKFKNK